VAFATLWPSQQLSYRW